MKVAFIGLGVMGAPMARNLLKAGHEVTGFDVVNKGLDALVEAGGNRAGTIKAALEGAEVAITMLPDSPQVEEVAFAEQGLLASAKAGLLYIDNSSIAPPVARRVSAAARARGLRPLDAPVSGGEAGAIEGSLSIMVGGKAEDFEAARALLEAMGSTVAHVGGDGAGQTVKVANQLVVAGVIEAVAEATVLLQASDVDVPAALDVLAGGLAGNRILDRKRASMLAGDFTPGFRVDLHHKDLGNLLATAREVGVSLPLGGLVAELMAALRARGGGSLDHSALLLLVQAMSGRDGSGQK
ncbi:MAG: 2-hydroxy-3-oxopropionate reductase [Actinomycetota bacterium]|nr:2-hydroxy-3-oxopropionate reductase [Actinomycetota bacterium]